MRNLIFRFHIIWGCCRPDSEKGSSLQSMQIEGLSHSPTSLDNFKGLGDHDDEEGGEEEGEKLNINRES